MNRDRLLSILGDVSNGALPPEDAALMFEELDTHDLGYAHVDHHRSIRLGIPEVVYGQGKSAEQIIGISASLKERQEIVLVTRVDEEKARQVIDRMPELLHNPIAGTLLWTRRPVEVKGRGTVLVVAAGTSDLRVAEEAAVTAHAFGNEVETLYDVGIAGIHRLLEKNKLLRSAAVIIAVAGMEGALPSVIGGLVDRPVIAVPTSVGYGAAFGGIAALLGMLNSCAPGVVVVNIDNGFGAAYAATIMNR